MNELWGLRIIVFVYVRRFYGGADCQFRMDIDTDIAMCKRTCKFAIPVTVQMCEHYIVTEDKLALVLTFEMHIMS